jgi:hypothetical protein
LYQTISEERAFLKHMQIIETDLASFFLNGKEGFKAWEVYINTRLHILSAPFSLAEKNLEMLTLNIIYQNLYIKDLKLPLISLKHLMEVGLSGVTSEPFKEIITFWNSLSLDADSLSSDADDNQVTLEQSCYISLEEFVKEDVIADTSLQRETSVGCLIVASYQRHLTHIKEKRKIR